MSNTTSQPFTETYFFQEVCRFREMMGTRSFWKLAEGQGEAALNGLGFVYLNVDNEDGSKPTIEQIEKWARIYDSAILEYHRREFMMLQLSLKPRLTTQ